MLRALIALVLVAATARAAAGDPPPVVTDVDLQPLAAQTRRVARALADAGAPLPPAELARLRAARDAGAIQRTLDPHVLAVVHVNPEQRVQVTRGPAIAHLDENGWRSFLIKVVNEPGATAPLRVDSPEAAPIYRMAFPDNRIAPPLDIRPDDVAPRWLALELHARAPMAGAELSGLEVEYRVLHLHCADRDLGAATPRGGRAPFRREAHLAFDVGAGTADLAHRAGIDVLFTCEPSQEVVLEVRDEQDRPTVASFEITDTAGRTFPGKAKRLAPDFFFHPQVYRRSGETVDLPAGRYTVVARRGPEYLVQRRTLVVKDRPRKLAFRLKRWIVPAALGWVSGDHHIHAAGCVHYENPTQGVLPQDIWRHVQGEDLKIGSVLTWGPCYGYQKQFFTGKPHGLSDDRNLLRYDVEVSGFGSHKAGHLVLLGLTQQDYPGARTIEDWPHLGLDVLRWAKKQGAVTGAAHTGWGLEVAGAAVPSLEMPRFDGIGGMELVVQLTHQVPGPGGRLLPAIDFVSAVDTPYPWELSIWYHALDVGFRPRLAGETDFPCIYDDRVGIGRSYVDLGRGAALDFEAWRAGLAAGRSYVSDGRSHIIDFEVGGVRMGGELALAKPGVVRARAKVAALLPVTPDAAIAARPVSEMPYWHLERARVGKSRKVAVELVVNGRAVARQELVADGALREVVFDEVEIARSSWVAMRILPSSHANPVFVMVGGKPVRASKKSAEWLLRAVDVLWKQKSPTYLPREMKRAKAAYDHARRTYRAIALQSEVD
ncbi:MAG TPA: CehA/McbA family metallohydrolase [Kofleriaceae bacterium]|nr:CehA/McbA family metallohydrolase [Kofleriaceae bacterium]